MLNAEWRTLAPSLSAALAAGIRNSVLDGRIRATDQLPAERAAMTLLVAHLRPRSAVVENPTFFGILPILRRPGSRIAPVTVTPQGWNISQLATAFRRSTGGVALLIPDFHNPTGAHPAPGRKPAQAASPGARPGPSRSAG